MAGEEEGIRGRAQPGGELLRRFAARLGSLIERSPADIPEDETVTLEAETLVDDADAARATDIHLDPVPAGHRLRFRIDGQLVTIARLEPRFGRRLINQLRTLAGLDPVRATVPSSGGFTRTKDGEPLDVRVTEAPCVAGDKLSLRLLSPARLLADIRELGFSAAEVDYLLAWLDQVGGMLIAAGPTGSGKTTTLYTLLHQLKAREAEVVTLEEPVEYAVEGINQLSVSPETGLDFATGARGMLRMDPDYLIFGELRDRASARAAINAAAGGRATMGTLHARDAIDTVAVLRNFGLSDLDIASNLDLVVAQRLVRRICDACREEIKLPDPERAWLAAQGQEAPAVAYAGVGCTACGGLGYRGRVGLFELWRPEDGEYTQIAEHAPLHELRAALAERGHRFLLDDGLAKARAGVISAWDLRRLGALGARTGPAA